MALCVLASCQKGGGPPKDAPVPVELVAVETGPLLETLRATGTLDAEESVDLRPEIEGEVTSIQMTEGEAVKKGDVILQIDESKQQAFVAEAEAEFRLADENRRRADLLLTDGTISQQEHDQVISSFRRSEASLNLARKRLT